MASFNAEGPVSTRCNYMNAEVYEGRDGWLFLQGGTNELGTLYDRQSNRLPDAKLQRWKQLIEYRARELEALGIEYVHVNVPEKQTIYDNKFRDRPIVAPTRLCWDRPSPPRQ
jgi:hypothetical protein